MPKVTFITVSGERIVTEHSGYNLMETAVENDIEGIDGDCNGVCSCGTCHVYIDPGWVEAVGPPNDLERSTLEMQDGFAPNSRLGCQIELSPALDGLVVRVADA